MSPPDALANLQPLTQSSRCDADLAAHAVGRRPTPELLKAPRSGAGSVDVRTLAHHEPVSSSHHVERLNLVLDDEGRIGNVNCG